jgi:hypothetical protein
MKTNEQIFAEIKKQGFITKQQMQLLKNRSNREGKDLFDYSLIESINDGYGIPITREQGEIGLTWLKRFAKKRDTPFGWRELNIIDKASANGFTFRGFYDAAKYRGHVNLQPIYELNGMEYVPLTEPYVIG